MRSTSRPDVGTAPPGAAAQHNHLTKINTHGLLGRIIYGTFNAILFSSLANAAAAELLLLLVLVS